MESLPFPARFLVSGVVQPHGLAPRRLVAAVSLWLGLAGTLVASQVPLARPPLDSWVHLSDDEGLTHSDVRTIAQDQDGFIWLGTRMGGLLRFDGYDLHGYGHNPADAGSLAHNIIWCLLVDRRNRVWVGTEAGLSVLDRATGRFRHFRHAADEATSLPNNVVTGLLEDQAGRIWAGTRDGLARLDDEASGRFTRYRRADLVAGSPRSNTFRSLYEDTTTGLLWLGASDGLAAFDPRTGGFASFLHDPSDVTSVSNNAVNKVIRDPDGVFWAFTEGGLNAFVPTFSTVAANADRAPPVVFRRFRLPGAETNPGREYVRDGLIDRQNRLWLATRSGVHLLDRSTGRFTSYVRRPGDPTSLSDDLAHTLFEDRAGNIWVGTYTGGVNRLRRETKPFLVERHRAGDPATLPDDRVSGVAVAPNGRVWVTTANGLARRDEEGWTRFQHDPDNPASLPSNDLATLAVAPNGDVWIGSNYLGPILYDGQRFHRLPIRRDFPAPTGVYDFTGAQVNTLVTDQAGGVWLGARAYGLDYRRGDRFWHYDDSAANGPSPTRNPILGVTLANGDLWFATEKNGLSHFDAAERRFAVYPAPASGSGARNRTVLCLAPAPDGILWVGLADGVLAFDPATRTFTQSFTSADGLPNDAVMAAVVDRRGHVWAGTANGLAEIDPGTRRVRAFEKADGLPSNVFSQRAGALGADGRVYFGTRAGLVSFRPEAIQEEQLPPPVRITELRWLGNSSASADPPSAAGLDPLAGDAGHSLFVPAGRLGFSLKFAALDYAAPEKNRYRYRLEGWDDAWTSSNARERIASYTALPPGRYVFRVQASNPDGAWNHTGAALPIVVEPRYWETTWFRVAAVALVLALIAAAHQWRLQVTREHNRRLQEQVSQRTAELKREIGERERAQDALRDSHQELERRVRERTAQLAASNASLAAEMNERRKVEEQLRQSQKMEAIGQLAGGIAHDFNNLLTVILGHSELLTLGDLPPGDRDEAVGDIRAAAQRAANLTRQLLVFSRRAPMRLAVIDLNGLIQGDVDLLRRLIGEHIVFEHVLTPDPLPVYADTGMLQQLLLNLVINGRDAMPRGGRLTVTTLRVPLVQPDEQAGLHALPGEYARLSIADTGSGIPDDVLPRIFEPFFTTKEQGKGTGLGLAISHGIVQQHRGWIHVETRPGQGTSFHVWLPIDRRPAEAPAAEPPPPPDAAARATVLVVEDESAVRAIATRVLRQQGYEIIEAGSGSEALQQWALHGRRISHVLTDIVMPGSPDGHELAHRLRGENPRLRIITMSGYDPAAAAARTGARQAGDVQLRKPFTVAELLAAFAERTG